MYQRVFKKTFARFSPAPVGLFSRSRLRGTQGGAACTPRRKFGYRAGSVARALGVQSHEILASTNHGVDFLGARAEHDNGKPICQLFCSTAVKGSNTATTIASSFARSYKLRALLCVRGPLYAVCGHDVCVTRKCCVCVCTGLSMRDAC